MLDKIKLFIKYLQSVFLVPDTEDTVVNKIGKAPGLLELTF